MNFFVLKFKNNSNIICILFYFVLLKIIYADENIKIYIGAVKKYKSKKKVATVKRLRNTVS